MPRKMIFPAIVCILLTASCSPKGTTQGNSCEMADRGITFQNLFQNSMTSAYEMCLSDVRDKAAAELGR